MSTARILLGFSCHRSLSDIALWKLSKCYTVSVKKEKCKFLLVGSFRRPYLKFVLVSSTIPKISSLPYFETFQD